MPIGFLTAAERDRLNRFPAQIPDDDLFAFINKKLVIDLGGVHGEQSASVDLDAVAAGIGLTIGKVYPLDMFGAERHTSESHFRIDTTISCFTPQPPPQ